MRRKLHAIRLDKIAAVDRPCQEHATVAILKRAPDDTNSPEEMTMKIETKAALSAAIAKFDPTKSPVAEVAIIRKAATDLKAEDLLPAEGPLAAEKADPKVAKLEREITILKMAAPTRAYFDGLDEAGQTAFLAKSEAEQKAAVDAANAEDPVVYTTSDGIAVRKSDGATALALAKSNDRLAKDVADLSKSDQSDKIEKRVAQYPNVAANVATDMVKSAASVGFDSDAGKGILATLDTMNKAQAGAFRVIGTSDGGPAPTVQKARQDFDGKVAEIKKRDNIGLAAAMSKARTEHPDLYEEAYPATVETPAEEPAA